MDIIYLFRVLLRRKWIILFSFIIGLTGGVAFTFFIPKQYSSTAQYSTGLYRTQKVSLQLNEMFDFGQMDYRLNNVIETFRSPIVLGMMSYDLLLHDLESPRPFRVLNEKQKKDSAFVKADFAGTKAILKEKLGSLRLLSTYVPQEKKVTDILDLYDYGPLAILEKITVERVPKTDYINVSFASENPELSAYVVNMIGIKFKEFYNSLTTTSTKESLVKLDSLRAAKRKEVDDLRNRLQAYRAKIGTPNLGDAATAAMSGYQSLTEELTNQEAALNSYKQKLNSINEQLAALNTNSGTDAAQAIAKGKNETEWLALRRANEILATQLAQKGGSDPDIQSKIDANTNKMILLRPSTTQQPVTPGQTPAEKKDALIKSKLEMETDINIATENIAMYRTRVDEFHRTAFSGGGEEVIAHAYENDLATAEKDLEKYNSTLFASQDFDVSPDFNFKPTIIGQPPIKAEPTHRILIVSIAGLAMFFIACLFLIILELLDSSLRTPTIFQKETHLNVVSVVGDMDFRRKPLKEYLDAGIQNNREHSSSPFIQNLRKLRYEIESRGKKVILVTSPKSQEGKSTIMESLAYTFSMSKKKVLLIDANFSNNTLTREFSAVPTLENFHLNGQDNGMDKIWGITTLTSITNTDIVGCGEGNYTPSEILPPNNLFSNINKIVQHYDFILIEGAALNDHADSRELAEYAEGIVAVFSAKNSIHESDKEAIQFLNTSGNKFIGVVLNMVDEDNFDL